jgi:phage terminase large subunit-like protein
MPGSVAALEQLILDERIRLRKSPVLLSALMGVAIETDPLMGNQWFSKKKATIRIDPAVALAMAVGAALDGRREIKPASSPWDDPTYSLSQTQAA